jgi:hypothetical protein
MRLAVLVAFVLPACGFSAPQGKPGNGGVTADAPAIDSPVAPMPDAAIDAAIDAAPDAPPDAPPVWTTIDTLTVSCRGMTLTSNVVLQQGTTYKLRASGECIANDQNGSKADAEYVGYNINQNVPLDSVSNVDNGIAVNDTTTGTTKDPRWGMFASNHQYEVMWPGTGAAITVKYHSADYSNNSGSLTLQIQSLQ